MAGGAIMWLSSGLALRHDNFHVFAIFTLLNKVNIAIAISHIIGNNGNPKRLFQNGVTVMNRQTIGICQLLKGF